MWNQLKPQRLTFTQSDQKRNRLEMTKQTKERKWERMKWRKNERYRIKRKQMSDSSSWPSNETFEKRMHDQENCVHNSHGPIQSKQSKQCLRQNSSENYKSNLEIFTERKHCIGDKN